MTQRYALLIMLLSAVFTQTKDRNSVGLIAKEKSTFFYTTTLSSTELADSSGKTITASGYYLLDKTVTTSGSGAALTITGNNIVIDLDGLAIVKGGSSTTAIAISANSKNISIINGSIDGAFTTAGITVGTGAANILIEQMDIDGCTINGINALGGSGTEIKGLTLRNVSITNCPGTGGSDTVPLELRYIHGLVLNNVISNSSSSGADDLFGIRVRNSNNIFGTDITSINHSGTGATRGCIFVTCDDIDLMNVNISQLSDETDGNNVRALTLSTVTNAQLSNISANNITYLESAFRIETSDNIAISNFTISNGTGGTATSDHVYPVVINSSESVTLNHGTISNCTSDDANFEGVSIYGTSKHIVLENIDIVGNTTTSGNMTGIYVAATTGLEVIKCNVCNNTSANTANQTVKGFTTNGTLVKDLIIRDSKFNANSSSTTANAGFVSGIYFANTVTGCEIHNTEASRNTGSRQAIGFNLYKVDNLIMKNCTARGNAAALVHSAGDDAEQEGNELLGTPDGIAALPSAGLYLLTSNHAYIENCKFINNKGGNYAEGDTAADNTISVATACSGHGAVNVGTSTSVPNVGNSFVNCIFQGNSTQLLNKAPIEPQTAYDTNSIHWLSEAFASGATEDHTQGSSYLNCQFNANGIYCDWAVGFGLCVATGCTKLLVRDCTASNNNWYGFYDNTATTAVTTFVGCVSSMNGVENTKAVTAQSNANTRNFNINKATAPYKSVTVENRSSIEPIGSAYTNLSITPI